MALSQRAFSSSKTALGPVRVSRAASVSVFARESRIGSKPITIPKGVTITLDGTTLKVKVRLRWPPFQHFAPLIDVICN
jgi:hypothetical protein